VAFVEVLDASGPKALTSLCNDHSLLSILHPPQKRQNNQYPKTEESLDFLQTHKYFSNVLYVKKFKLLGPATLRDIRPKWQTTTTDINLGKARKVQDGSMKKCRSRHDSKDKTRCISELARSWNHQTNQHRL
jgi:hypothetical protein